MHNSPLVVIESEQRVVACLAPGSVPDIASGEHVIFAVFPPKFLGQPEAGRCIGREIRPRLR